MHPEASRTRQRALACAEGRESTELAGCARTESPMIIANEAEAVGCRPVQLGVSSRTTTPSGRWYWAACMVIGGHASYADISHAGVLIVGSLPAGSRFQISSRNVRSKLRRRLPRAEEGVGIRFPGRLSALVGVWFPRAARQFAAIGPAQMRHRERPHCFSYLSIFNLSSSLTIHPTVPLIGVRRYQ